MTIQETFAASEHALTAVVNQIKDEQWQMTMPSEFATRTQSSITLREVINYHAYDDIWVPETLAGKTIEEVGDTFAGDLLGKNPQAAWGRIVDAAIAAVNACDLEKTVHLTYGDYPASEYLRHIISFRGLRAVDIARAIGVSDRLPEGLAGSMYDLFLPDVETWRAMGVFKAAVPVPDEADAQAKLLGMTGRQP